MKTLKQLNLNIKSRIKDEYDPLNKETGLVYYEGYKTAIEGIYKDIKESGSLSVESIEKYLEELIKEND